MLEISKAEIRSWSRIGSRAAFGMAILKLADVKNDFYVVSADLCNSSGLDRFRNKYPEELVNVGIAEQDMIGIAGGLAKDGTPVFATSFAPFISMRACEQIRMNLGYMGLNVKAVGIGSGLAMTNLGNSHYGIEDMAVMRAIPNMLILSPADCTETVKCVEAAKEYQGPVYLRLTGIANNPVVYDTDYEYRIGKANVLRQGEKVAIIATGTMVYQSLKAAETLESEDIHCTVVDMHTIKPLDTEVLEEVLGYDFIVTAEEHTVIGGLGSAVAEYLSPKKKRPRHLLIGIQDTFLHAGDYEYLLRQCGLTAEQIADKIRENL